MSQNAYSANDFMQYFKGNESAHGVTKLLGMKEGKMQVECRKQPGPVDPSVMARHLNGEESIGAAPLQEDGSCLFGAIDMDNVAPGQIEAIVHAIYKWHLPLCPHYSKSKKLHIYIFFSDPVPAADVQELLRWYCITLGGDMKTEIFPKQSRTSSRNKFYSWINLPYFEADKVENPRKLINNDMSLASLVDALDYYRECQLSFKEHRAIRDQLPFTDAPVCVARGWCVGDIPPGTRNNWLLAAGVYFRRKDPTCDLESKLLEINEGLINPLEDSEVIRTVVTGMGKKTYYYPCSQLEGLCVKSACITRKNGFEENSGIDYGQLRQLQTTPVSYEWEITRTETNQTVTIKCANIEELRNQHLFVSKCLDTLHWGPQEVKPGSWTTILNRAFGSVEVVEASEVDNSFTAGDTALELMKGFFGIKRKARSEIECLGLKGRPMEEGPNYLFSATAIWNYMQDRGFKLMTAAEFRDYIQARLGAMKDSKTKLWAIAKNKIPELPSRTLDFHDDMSEEPF